MCSQLLDRKLGQIFCLIALVGLAAMEAVPGGQSTAKPRPGVQKTAKTSEEQFTCPDPLAVEACKSFEELYKAGDESVRPIINSGTSYVCFRENNDQFFTVEVGPALFTKQHLDPQTRKWVPDDDATAKGWGLINAFAHGIKDFSIHPILSFEGTWGPQGPTFTASAINSKEISEPDRDGITLDPEQFYATWRFKNKLDKDIDYKLVIQLSTGRFSESFVETTEKIPFLQTNGRCLHFPLPQPRGTRFP